MPSLNSIFPTNFSFRMFGTNKAKQEQDKQPEVKAKTRNAGKKIILSSLDAYLLKHHELNGGGLIYQSTADLFSDDLVDDERINALLEAARSLNGNMAEKGRKRKAGPIPPNNVTVDERVLATYVDAQVLRPGITLYDGAIKRVDEWIAEYAPQNPEVVRTRKSRMLEKTFRQARVQLEEIATEAGDEHEALRASAKTIADEHLKGREPDHKNIYDNKKRLATLLFLVGTGECAINFNTFVAFLDDSIISYIVLTGILGATLAVSAHYVGINLPRKTKKQRVTLAIASVVALMALGYINWTRLANGLENIPYVISGVSLWLFGMFFSNRHGERAEYWTVQDAAKKARTTGKQAENLRTELDARISDYVEDAVEDIMNNKEASKTTLTKIKARLEAEKANFESEVGAIYRAGCETYREAYRELREELAQNSSRETWDASWKGQGPKFKDALGAQK